MLQSRNTKVQRFLNDVINDLKKLECTLEIRCGNSKSYSLSGYFDEEKKKIVVYKDRKWLDNLVHEYCHFLQFKNKNKRYTTYHNQPFTPTDIIEQWLKKKITYSTKVKKSFDLVRGDEAECETMAVSIIKKYDLPINLKNYKHTSNMYLIFYHCVEKTGRWNTENFYNNRKLKNLVPTNQKCMMYSKKVPQKVLETALYNF